MSEPGEALRDALEFWLNSGPADATDAEARLVIAAREWLAAPVAGGLDARLSDCEDALATVEVAYDRLAAPVAGEGWTWNGWRRRLW